MGNNRLKAYIKTKQKLIDSTTTYGFYTAEDNERHQAYKHLSFQRDETYRFGIVCFNEKFQPSFVQLSGNPDIRMPDFDKAPLTYYEPSQIDEDGEFIGGDNTYANLLQIEFDVSEIDFPEGTVAYQIVRVPRTLENRSVLDMGLVGPLLEASRPSFTEAASLEPTQHVEFTSPEILYDRTPIQGQEIEAVARLRIPSGTRVTHRNRGTHRNEWIKSTKFNIMPGSFEEVNGRRRIEDYQIHEFVNDPFHKGTFQGRTYNNFLNNFRISDGSWGRQVSLKGTCGLVYAPGWFGEDYRGKVILARRRKNGEYGNPETNVFIPCSYIQGTQHKTITAWGDTYIKMFEFLRGINSQQIESFHIRDESDSFNLMMLNAIVPVETSIDLDFKGNPTFNSIADRLEYDPLLKKGYSERMLDATDEETRKFAYRGMQERKGIHDINRPGREGENYRQEFDLYTYNRVYSRQSDVRTYQTRPETLRRDESIDVRIYHSDRKIDMELEDSWLVFRDFLDLDNRFGPLTRLLNFKNDLYFFQPKGYGVLSVDQRELIQTQVGTSLSLGTGGILDRYDYLSTETGTSFHDSIAASERTLYFIDDLNKKLSRVGENQTENLIDRGMLKSWATKLDFNKCLSTYHSPDNTIVFSVDDEDSLIFNEDVQRFTGFYGFKPDMMFNMDSMLFSYKLTNPREDQNVYLFNGKGFEKNQFHGSKVPSVLELIINPQGRMVQRFDVLSFLTYLLNRNNQEQNDRSFDSIQVENSYQDTGVIQFSDEAIRRHKVWRLNQFRDENTEERIKDSYIKVRLVFNNDNNDTIKIDDIVIDHFPIKPY